MSKQFDYVNNVVDDDTELDITPLVEPVATCLIVIGIVLFVIAFLGFCGACCDSRLLLALVSLSPVLLRNLIKPTLPYADGDVTVEILFML